MSPANPFVKVCGMTVAEEARAVAALGVDALGFIFHPRSPRHVDPSLPASLSDLPVERVGVFVSQTAEEVCRIMDQGRLTLAQLHGNQDPEFCRRVGPMRVVRAFWPERYESRAALEEELRSFEQVCRFFLLDAGKDGGGHGRSLDFAGLAGLHASRPWLLAGGLGPHNLHEALAARPNGVDLNSGVETSPGRKDLELIRRALAILHKTKEPRI